MITSRRGFLRTGSISLAALAIGPHTVMANIESDVYLAIQLYTVRSEMDKDPAGTLRKLAEMGYRYVEHANYHDRKFYGYSASGI